MRVRTRARELALQFLYMIDVQGPEYRESLDAFLSEDLRGDDGVEKPGAAEAKEYARRLVDGTTKHRAEIDALLGEAARNWDLSRMAVVDRNVLRLGCYEMLHEPDVPTKVAINEAIELGKRFGGTDGHKYVNGVLDKLAAAVRPEEVAEKRRQKRNG
jgi:transcription antitermination factor NusB